MTIEHCRLVRFEDMCEYELRLRGLNGIGEILKHLQRTFRRPPLVRTVTDERQRLKNQDTQQRGVEKLAREGAFNESQSTRRFLTVGDSRCLSDAVRIQYTCRSERQAEVRKWRFISHSETRLQVDIGIPKMLENCRKRVMLDEFYGIVFGSGGTVPEIIQVFQIQARRQGLHRISIVAGCFQSDGESTRFKRRQKL